MAGLTAALEAAPCRVSLLTKGPLGSSGATPLAQGGVAAALGPDDSPYLHAADTLAAGLGLSDPGIVGLLAREAAERLAWLLGLGVPFDRDGFGGLALGREGAHSRRRILHAQGDGTGAEMIRALVQEGVRRPEIRVFQGAFAWDLVVEEGRVVGLLARHPGDRWVLHRARAVVLATGGIGRLYAHTTNPAGATGDGLALAARAGALLADLEFVQFHPTALAVGEDPMPLVTEALRGEGAILVDEFERPILSGEHPAADLAPRDVVARVVWRELRSGHRVFLDARAVGKDLPRRFPTVFALCQRYGVDPRRDLIPVAPAAHYHMGGVAVDSWGRTSVAGLWACGEVAATGAHGANRLASNSLLEGLVFGARVGQDLRDNLPALERREVVESGVRAARGEAEVPAVPKGLRDLEIRVADIRTLMWDRVGLVRDAPGLQEALQALAQFRDEIPVGAREVQNLLLAGEWITRAALARTESRGAHFRADFPEPNRRWERRSFLDPRGLQEGRREGGMDEAVLAGARASKG